MAKLKKRPDGRYVKTFTDPRTGKRVFIYGESEREINQKMLGYTAKAERGRCFAEVSDLWWEETEPQLAFQSIRTYNQAKKRADAEFADTPLKEIQPRHIQLFLQKLARQGYAQKTISNQRMVVNLIFQYAVLQNDIVYNPCASVSIPKNLPKKERTAASPSDEETIKKSADVWLFPYIAIMTGMRKGEILALQWSDIDFDNDLIHVTKSVYHEGDRPSVKCPKTEAGNRIVPLLSPLKSTFLSIPDRIPDHYIISDDGTNPLTNRRFITLSNHFKKKTGVTCTAHQLRHSFATIAFECGLPPKTVQEILGHKQLSTTMDLYTEFRKKALLSAATKLNDAMK